MRRPWPTGDCWAQKKCTQAAIEGLKIISLLYNHYKKGIEAKCRLKWCGSALPVPEDDRTDDSNRVLQDLTDNFNGGKAK
jgi:hypothetical protein